jgi:hypothetical protein
MIEQAFVDWIGLALAVWSVFYIADYYLTIYAARLYRTTAQAHFNVLGSYELTPYFQKDVNALKLVSARFVAMLVLSWVLITLIWFLSVKVIDFPELYLLALGGLVLRESVVHLRHVRNIATFHLSSSPGAVEGSIVYSRPFSLRLSAVELSAFAVFCLLLSLVVGSWFVLGGALACGVLALQHWRLAIKSSAQPRVIPN